MADVADHGFTPQQIRWLDRRFAVFRGFDRPTVMWMVGGLTAIGIGAAGFLWAEIESLRVEVRGEIGSVRGEIGFLREELGGEIDSLRDEVRENRAAITELAKGLARIEAILEERLPRER